MSNYQSKTAQRGFSRRGDRGAPTEKPQEAKATLRRLLSYFKAEMTFVFLLIGVVSIGVVALVLAPVFQSRAIDTIIAGRYERLGHYLVMMVVGYLIYGVATLLQGYLSSYLSQRVVRRIRRDLFTKIVYLPIAYIDTHSHGDLISRMTNDADNISNIISESLSALFSGVLTLTGTLIIMLSYHVPLTLLTCSTVILTLLLTRFLTKKLTVYFVKRQHLLGVINGTIEEMVTHSHTVTAFSMQEGVIADFEREADDLTRTGIIAEIISSSMGPLMNTLNNVAFVIVAVFGAYFAYCGYISIGVISAFIIYAKQFSRPINEMAQLYGQIQTALAGAERIFTILDEADEDQSGQAITHVQGVIEFQHVDFSYVPGKKVIDDFSLRIDSGKKIALVGSTGSGKTTIINLLMRFYKVDRGAILLDGVNINDIATTTLRDHIGIVLQDTQLFTDTIRHNLTYAADDIGEDELVEAVEMSYASGIIAHLPDGYETMLSGAGANLSQGQRQLLTIGRAFLSKPDILILDEATSSVDTRTEKHIQDAMVNLMRGRTSLIIAHRLSTIQDADEIIVMDAGRIVERGNHASLLRQKGVYYDLYMTQFAGVRT